MKTLGTIEGEMYIQASKRSPVMVIEGNKRVAVEEKIKAVLGHELKIITSCCPRWAKLAPNEVLITPSSGKSFATGSISDILPHVKKVKITIEVEE